MVFLRVSSKKVLECCAVLCCTPGYESLTGELKKGTIVLSATPEYDILKGEQEEGTTVLCRTPECDILKDELEKRYLFAVLCTRE